MSLIAANHVLKHAYTTSAEFRAEHALLLAVFRFALQQKEVYHALWREHRRAKCFDLFLPFILEYLDASSLVAAEAVSKTWAQECRRNHEALWENLLRTKFQLTARQFLKRSRSMSGDEGADGSGSSNSSSVTSSSVTAKELYKAFFQKMRAVLRGNRALMPFAIPRLPL